MVPGARLLLKPARLGLLLALAAGCKAETLGVDVPRGGPEAISQEDLQRDLWRLASARRPRAAQAHVGLRLQEMHLLPAFGEEVHEGALSCAQKDGRSGKGVVIVALSEGAGATSRDVPTAVLISLAKAWDVPRPPRDTLVFCRVPGEAGLADYAARPALPLADTRLVVTLGPMAGGELRAAERPALGPAPRLHLDTALPAWAGTDEDRMERLDFRRLADTVRAAYDLIVARTGA